MMLEAIFALLCLVPVLATAAATEVDDSVDWQPRGALAVPDLPEAIPAMSAGCVVVGHHVLADGSTAHPRIMKGAFTSRVDRQMQVDFSARVLKVVPRWQFDHVGEGDPSPRFHMEAVGFLPAGAGGPRVVAGAARQFEGLRDICKIDDLAAWGQQNAIPLEQALARNGDKVLVRGPGSLGTYWVPAGERTPPRYPSTGHAHGIYGCVVVGFTVQPDGSVGGLKITRSDLLGGPDKRMRQAMVSAAASALATWRYAPGPDNLSRLPEFMQVPVEFIMDDQGSPTGTCKGIDVTVEAAASP
jgi:hypothetical protein